jgi:hypothetical protein
MRFTKALARRVRATFVQSRPSLGSGRNIAGVLRGGRGDVALPLP